MILGDLAQATSPWAHESWDEVVEQLRHNGVSNETVELELGYRLPAEVHEVAMRLLPEVAPTLQSPRAVRRTGHDVMVTTTAASELAAVTVATIRDLLGTGLIGVVCPRGRAPSWPTASMSTGWHGRSSSGRQRHRWWCWAPTRSRAWSSIAWWWSNRRRSSPRRSTGCDRCSWPSPAARAGWRSCTRSRCPTCWASLRTDPTPGPRSRWGEHGRRRRRGPGGRADDGSTAVVVNLQVVDDDEPSGAVVVDLAQALGQAAAIGAEEGNILDPIDAAIARDASTGSSARLRRRSPPRSPSGSSPPSVPSCWGRRRRALAAAPPQRRGPRG